MSFRVLVVPEDPTNNGDVLKPLVEAVLAAAGRPRAAVLVLTSPRMRGYDAAKAFVERSLAERYGHYDLLLFLPDADGKDRAREFQALERSVAEQGATLVCCAAVQEVETWLLAGHASRVKARWADIRADVDVKERHFEPFLEAHGDRDAPGGGRRRLMIETVANFEGLATRCPEIGELTTRIGVALSRRADRSSDQ